MYPTWVHVAKLPLNADDTPIKPITVPMHGAYISAHRSTSARTDLAYPALAPTG